MKFVDTLKARWMVWVWHHTPHCAEMARLASLSFEQPPSWKTRLKMRLHYLICVWCERYAKHLQFLHRAAPRLPERFESDFQRKLSEATKHRMMARCREELHQGGCDAVHL